MKNSQLFQTTLGILTSSLSILTDKPEETPTSCLMALWHKASGVQMSAGSAPDRPLDPLTPEGEKILRDLTRARLNGMPLAYLTERQQFMGLDFISTPQAVIPRKDTEPLVKAALNQSEKNQSTSSQQIIVDLFTGSGNVLLTLAKLAPGHRYFGCDLSPDAICLAKRNAQHLKLESACTFVCGDMFAPFDSKEFYGQIDIITGAPPFISSHKVSTMPREISQHEPRLAFDAGPFGLSIFVRLIAEAPKFLKNDGWLFFEVGLGQGSGISNRLSKDPRYYNIKTFCDEAGDIRVVAAQKNGNSIMSSIV